MKDRTDDYSVEQVVELKDREDYTHTDVADIVSRERTAFAIELLEGFENDIMDILEMDQKHKQIMGDSEPLCNASRRALDILETRIEILRIYCQDALQKAINKLKVATDWYIRSQGEMLEIKLDYFKENSRSDCLDFCIDSTFQCTLKALRHYCKAE